MKMSVFINLSLAILVFILKLETDVSLPNYLFWGSHKAYSFHIFGQAPCTFFYFIQSWTKKSRQTCCFAHHNHKTSLLKTWIPIYLMKKEYVWNPFPPFPSHQAMLYICKKKVRNAVLLNIACWGWGGGMCCGGSWKVKSVDFFFFFFFFFFIFFPFLILFFK